MKLPEFLSGLIYNVKSGLLWIFGKIRIHRWPMFFVFDPRGYNVKADKIRRAMAEVRPGDILLRRYDNYLDGYFIPGRFSHSGVYIGDGLIVHAMSSGVQKIDIIDFLRCDGFAILRTYNAEAAAKAPQIALSYVGRRYDYGFDICEDYGNSNEVDKRTKALYCHELTRSCFPRLDVPTLLPELWNGMIRSSKRQFLADSFFESPDFTTVYDSDFSEPKCDLK